MKRNAFTLIELLVVIAIIAILAAILFPVFAQAKAAAKAAASVSNSKQIGTSSFMYSADYDDKFIIPVAWGTPGAPVSYGQNYSPWSWLMLPYMKSFDIFQDPLAPAGETWNLSFVQKGAEKVIEPQYGYNHVYLTPAPFNNQTGYAAQPKSQTDGADVANTVMFASKASTGEDDQPVTSIYGYFGGNGPTAPTVVDGPICDPDMRPNPTDGMYYPCFASWGKNNSLWSFHLKNNPVAGAYTGANSLRASGNVVVLFADGHTSKKSPGALSNGTNWTPTINASAMIWNDRTKNMYSLTKLNQSMP